MDLIILVLILALIGFFVHLITTRIPMDPMFRTAILIIVVIAVILYLLKKFGASIPNVM